MDVLGIPAHLIAQLSRFSALAHEGGVLRRTNWNVIAPPRAMAVEKERAVFVRNLPVCPLPDMEELLYELFLQVTHLLVCVCVCVCVGGSEPSIFRSPHSPPSLSLRRVH